MALEAWKDTKVVILGDVILDRFVYGSVHRISPEAPIPVVEVTGERMLPGGAANVASNVQAMGGRTVLLGVVGEDAGGEDFRRVAEERSIDISGLITLSGRATTVKTRIVAHQQQVVRIDHEEKTAIPGTAREELLERLSGELPGAGVLVVSDYAKGVLGSRMLLKVGRMAREARLPYVVDPKPIHFPYPGASLVTPNRQEAAGFIGKALEAGTLPEDAERLLGKTDWGAVLFTLGAEGMVLVRRGFPPERIPARVREVFDVTGAGDTVVAAVSLALAADLGFTEAARIANAAAGVVVGKAGTAVCTPEELEAALAEAAHG